MSGEFSPNEQYDFPHIESRWGDSRIVIPNLGRILIEADTQSVSIFEEEISKTGQLEKITATVDRIERENEEPTFSWSASLECRPGLIKYGQDLALKRSLFESTTPKVNHYFPDMIMHDAGSGVGVISQYGHDFGVFIGIRTRDNSVNVSISNNMMRTRNDIKKGAQIVNIEPDSGTEDIVNMAMAFGNSVILMAAYINGLACYTNFERRINARLEKMPFALSSPMYVGKYAMSEYSVGKNNIVPVDQGLTLTFGYTGKSSKSRSNDAPGQSVQKVPKKQPAQTQVPPQTQRTSANYSGTEGSTSASSEFFSRKEDRENLKWSSDNYITDAIVETKPKYTLEDFQGSESIRKAIRDIALEFKNKKVLEKWGVLPTKGLLLYGPPGTGKNMLAHALAKEINATLWEIDGSKLYDMYLGLSAKNLSRVFERISDYQWNLVVFIDEIDTVFSNDSGPQMPASRERNTVAGIFKKSLNDLAQNNKNVLLVGATNYEDRIDPSLIRSGRFDRKIFVDLPDDTSRGQIISNIIAKTYENSKSVRLFADDVNVPEIANYMHGMSGADIAEIFDRIYREKALHEASTGISTVISHSDIYKAIETFRTAG